MATSVAAAEPAWMTTLFRPTNRFRDEIREWEDNDFYDLPQELTEVELLPHLTPQDVLATAGIAWGGFCFFLLDMIVWMTPGVYICIVEPWVVPSANSRVLSLGANNHRDHNLSVYVALGTPSTAAGVTCDCVLRLLATSEHPDVGILGRQTAAPPPLSGAALALFFLESRSCLRQVTLSHMLLSEDLCRALATMPRLDVELKILCCGLEGGDAAGAFVECLHSDRGPVKLDACVIASQIIASALTGDSRVTRFKPYHVPTNDAHMAVFSAALANNRGLLVLELQGSSFSDANWSVLCESLQAHSTLTILVLRNTSPWSPADGRMVLTEDQKVHRTRAMMQQNTVLHTIDLSDEHFPHQSYDQQIYDEDISPHLEMNRFRPRVHAIKKADFSLRRPLLGLALQTDSVRINSNLLWMFLSGNPDVVLQSNADDEQEVEAAGVPVEAAGVQLEIVAGVPAELPENARKRTH
jgi:hypothetical protein